MRRRFAAIAPPAFMACAVLAAISGGAEPMPSAGPRIAPLAPNGMTRGTTLDLTLTGTGLDDAIGLGAPFARVTTPTDGTPGNDSTKARWMLSVGPDQQPGWGRVRLLTGGGLSNFRAFCIDTLPQIVAKGNARTKESAQAIAVPCVVVGRVAPETSEFFRFPAIKGQRLSFEVLGRRLGSALDPWIKLYDARTGRELPRAYCDDAPGLQSDSQLTQVFSADGDYLIEVRDSMWRGGDDFHYRLRIGDFPCAIATLPLAATRGRKVGVAFAGPMVDGVAPIELDVPADPAVAALPLVPLGAAGLAGWPVTIALSDFDEIVAQDPTPSDGQPLPVPCGVTGRFARKSQVDRFRFSARKDQKYIVAAPPGALLSQSDVFITVRDPAGTVIAKSQPDKPAAIEFTAAAEGLLTIAVEHLNYAFGPNEVYRFTIAQPAPGFELTLAADAVNVGQGQSGLIAVQTLMRQNYGGPIELSVVGAEGIVGTLPVTAGAESGPPPPPGQPAGAAFAMLPIRIANTVSPGVYEVQVRAKATVDGRELTAYASTTSIVSQAMAGLPFPPRTWLRTVAVGVLPKPPFQLAARFEPPEAVRGLTTNLVVTAVREAGFDGPIDISASGLPPNVTAANRTLEAGSTEARLEVKLSERAALGSYSFTVIGRGQVGPRSAVATRAADPLLVVRPVELKVEPNPATISPGEKASLQVTATRKGGYSGKIDLELRNLPAQVTAAKAVIAEGQNAATVELSAAAAAPLGARGDVDVLGTIALGQQQSASPSFVVKVQPPAPVLTVKCEPPAIVIKPGSKVRVRLIAERKNLAGPIVISVAGAPANVTASELTIAADQTTGEIEFAMPAVQTEASKVEVTVTAKCGATSAATKIAVQIEPLMDR